MSDPHSSLSPPAIKADSDALGAEEVSHVRHDLRTFVNHIMGYSEMLLEIAREDGMTALVPGLEDVHQLGGKILERIGAILAPSRTDVTRMDFQKLADELAPWIESLQTRTKGLLELTQKLDRDEEKGDLNKILGAVHQLRNFMKDRMLDDLPSIAARSAALASRGVATGAADAKEADHPSHPSAPRADGEHHDDTITGQGRILIVDDVANNRDMLQRRLERQGYKVQQAINGREALQKIALGGLDLVLLDILMPEVDGYEVLRQVKSTPTGRDLPIIMISSLDEIQSVVRCIEMGAEDYLPKPFDPVLLRARVGACLEKKRLRDQELDYLRQVTSVITAAGAVEAGQFEPESLQEVAQRVDALGQLARVFQRMGREVQAREQRLQQQVQQLKIEIDESRKKRQVAEVTETEYFQALQQRAQELRKRSGKPAPSDPP